MCYRLHCKEQGCSHSCYHQLRHLLKLSVFRFCAILKYGTVLRHICSNTICSFNFAQPTLCPLVNKTCSIHFSRLRYVSSHVNTYSIHFSYPSLCVSILNTYNSFLLTSITCIRRQNTFSPLLSTFVTSLRTLTRVQSLSTIVTCLHNSILN